VSRTQSHDDLSNRIVQKLIGIYDLRTNQHFTLKERPMTQADLDDFVACHRPGHRHERKARVRG
jgi:type I restriction enzyme M protein